MQNPGGASLAVSFAEGKIMYMCMEFLTKTFVAL